MPDRVRIDAADALPVGAQNVYTIAGERVAVFNAGGALYAVENACPHRGASLGKGTCAGTTVTCPLHGWAFDLATGRCADQPEYRLRRFEVFRQGEDLFLDLTPLQDAPAAWDGVYRYLVRYGAMGWVGRFGSIEPIPCGYRDPVLVRTARGLEVGEVLSGPNDGPTADAEKPAGEVLRRLSAQEVERSRQASEPRELLERGRRLLARRDLPVEFLDVECLFDGETTVLYYLGTPDPQLDGLASELERELARRVQFQPIIDSPTSTGGCGSGGCGCAK